jgi:hypothetical protein
MRHLVQREFQDATPVIDMVEIEATLAAAGALVKKHELTCQILEQLEQEKVVDKLKHKSAVEDVLRAYNTFIADVIALEKLLSHLEDPSHLSSAHQGRQIASVIRTERSTTAASFALAYLQTVLSKRETVIVEIPRNRMMQSTILEKASALAQQHPWIKHTPTFERFLRCNEAFDALLQDASEEISSATETRSEEMLADFDKTHDNLVDELIALSKVSEAPQIGVDKDRLSRETSKMLSPAIDQPVKRSSLLEPVQDPAAPNAGGLLDEYEKRFGPAAGTRSESTPPHDIQDERNAFLKRMK